MKLEEFEITSGLNSHQNASIERNDKTIDYNSSRPLSYKDVLNITKGLNVISEFFDVNAIVMISGTGVCGAALGKSIQESVISVMENNPVDFAGADIVSSAEIDSDTAKLLKQINIVAAPKFTKNAIEYLESHNICHITIETPLKEYKKYLANETIKTPLGTLIQTPNLSELNKKTFKVISKTKPTVEQIEDAVFAWKIAKHTKTRAAIVAKDLKTSAVSEGLRDDAVEYALNKSCELAKDSVLASDSALNVHDINAAIQCRIGLIIIPSSSEEIVKIADKYSISLITTGIENLLY